MAYSQKTIETSIKIIKWFYFCITVGFGVGFVWLLIINSRQLALFFLIASLAFCGIFIGLQYKKRWIPLLMVMFSVFLVIDEISGTTFIISRFLGLVIALFLLFFFTRREVKNFFQNS